MSFHLGFALHILPALLLALRVTIAATFGGMFLALLLGLVWAILRRSRNPWVAVPIHWIVEFIRSTPLLIQIYFLFYVLPGIGLKFSPWVTGVAALGINYSAYIAEVYRAGIEGVAKGQWEAAIALNLSRAQMWRKVILPQALPPILPVLGNYWVAMFKDTPLLSSITVLEVLERAKIIGSETFRYLEPLTLVGLLFLVLSLSAAAVIRLAERHFHLGKA
ncbi:MAG: ectoine/hydroxyectoine ABC transporter permease subunit EhuD [bacterium]